MKNSLTNDCIAIDTNIFLHLFHPEINEENHIGELLNSVSETDDGRRVSLIVDAGGKIEREYERKWYEYRKVESQEHHRYRLEDWFLPDRRSRVQIPVDQNGALMRAIKNIVAGARKSGSSVDRIFVYVAIEKNRILITNDRADIIDGGGKPGERKNKLLRVAKKHNRKDARIYTSREAHQQLRQPDHE